MLFPAHSALYSAHEETEGEKSKGHPSTIMYPRRHRLAQAGRSVNKRKKKKKREHLNLIDSAKRSTQEEEGEEGDSREKKKRRNYTKTF